MMTARMMPKTLLDKLWDAHLVTPETEALPATLSVDLHLVHEVTTPQVFAELEWRGLKAGRPAHSKGTLGHAMPTRPVNADGVLSYSPYETLVARLRETSVQQSIELFDFGSALPGNVRIIGPKVGLTQPGMTIACGDSHTATHGAFGALAFGIGHNEVVNVLATQCLTRRKPRTLAIFVDGNLGANVTAQDLILHVIVAIGINGGTGYVIEYRGSTIRSLSMDERMTVCNMSMETGARAALIAPDEVTFEYLAYTPRAPHGDDFAHAVKRWRNFHSDDDARFDRDVRIDARDIRPVVAWESSMPCYVAEMRD